LDVGEEVAMAVERPSPREADGLAPAGRTERPIAPGPEALVPTTTGMTMASYFEAFSPVPAWADLPAWPPDVFALTNLVLDFSEGYRLAVAPPRGRTWPPTADWNEQVRTAARQWRDAAGPGHARPLEAVSRPWEVVSRHRDVPLATLLPGSSWELAQALLTLHAMADEACAGLATAVSPAAGSFEDRAWRLLEDHGSLSRIAPSRIRILPKTQFAARGITIRSLSRYLGLSYEAIDLRWRRIDGQGGRDAATDHHERNVLLVPWPLAITAEAFRAVEGPLLNMDPKAFGFFEFVPDAPLDVGFVERLVAEGRRKTGSVEAIVLPEAAIMAEEIPPLETMLAREGVSFLVAGVRERATDDGFGRNYIHLGVLTSHGWRRYQQDKHHRWCLDEGQIRQYHLSRMLDPRRQWWEAIDLPPRMVQILDIGAGMTSAPLVCEDLARMDEVMELLRRVGPSIILAVLLDGPQLATRWPCRYASVLVDEPGSAVLTLTSLGMAKRSTPAGIKPSRVIALWHDPRTGRHELELARGATAMLITASVRPKTVWTADGRRHERGTPDLTLSAVHQIRVPPPSPSLLPEPSA
jgi:hypothetical protein